MGTTKREKKIRRLKKEVKDAEVVVNKKRDELFENIHDQDFIVAYNEAATKLFHLERELKEARQHNHTRYYMNEIVIPGLD